MRNVSHKGFPFFMECFDKCDECPVRFKCYTDNDYVLFLPLEELYKCISEEKRLELGYILD